MRIRRRKARMEFAAFEQDAFSERRFERAVYAFLQGHERGCGERGDRGGKRQGLFAQGLVVHDARDEAVAVGFFGVEHARGQAHVHRLRLADGAGQALRAAGPWQQAELDFRQTEFRAAPGDDNVARQRELASAAKRQAGDRGDDGLTDLPDGLPVARDEIGAVDVAVGPVRHDGYVGARRESA